MTKRDARNLAVLFASLVALALWRLDLAPIVTMEGIVGAGARRMLAQGDWAVPHLYGEFYTFKPPLAWWLVAGSFRALGESAFTLRLPFALVGAAIAPMTYALVRAHTDAARALVAGLAATTGFLVLQKLRLAETDILLAFGAGGAMLAASSALARGSWSRWSAAYALFAFGVLAKGAPGVLFFAPGLVVASFALGRSRELVRARHAVPLVGALAVVGAWAWCAWQQSAGDAFAQPLAEASDRASAWTWSRAGEALARPLLVLVLFLPWSAFLPSALLARPKSEFARAAALFVVVGVVALMLVPRGSSRYFLPLTVPIGALVGLHLPARRFARFPHHDPSALVDVGLALVGVAAIAVSAGVPGGRLPLDVRLIAFALGALALFAAWRGLVRGDRLALALRLALTALALWVIVVFGLDLRRARRRSLDATAERFRAHLAADDVLWVDLLDKHSNLFFLLDRDVRRFRLGVELPPAGEWLVLEERQEPALCEVPNRAVRLIERSAENQARLGLWRVER
ncbi:MAG: glycosyltransferase family 39 protein [Planctomycetota bacterium]